ncbi:response regulator [soil metagenome]
MDKPVVLIVDDQPLIATMVEATLQDAGFEVVSVMDATEAAEQIAKLDRRLCALVTDIQLGAGPNGWAVATAARTKLPLLPVVYMTGDSAADWAAFGVPKSILIQKPFVGAQVLAAVTTLMNSDISDASSSA